MRIDDPGPRTWLLAGVAGWTVLAWLLALAGMGGRVTKLADDPGLLVPLPQSIAMQPALGPADQYLANAERPLFASDRRPHPFALEGGESEDPAEGFDYVLTSVLITPGMQLAIVRKREGGDPLRVKLDESLAQTGWRLIELTPRAAVFEGPQGRRSLDLQVFDGTGGEPASAALASAQAPQQTIAAQPANSPPQPQQRPPQERPRDPARVANGARAPAVEPGTADPSNTGSEPAQAQMDSIRQRIEARRAALRKDEM